MNHSTGELAGVQLILSALRGKGEEEEEGGWGGGGSPCGLAKRGRRSAGRGQVWLSTGGAKDLLNLPLTALAKMGAEINWRGSRRRAGRPGTGDGVAVVPGGPRLDSPLPASGLGLGWVKITRGAKRWRWVTIEGPGRHYRLPLWFGIPPSPPAHLLPGLDAAGRGRKAKFNHRDKLSGGGTGYWLGDPSHA